MAGFFQRGMWLFTPAKSVVVTPVTIEFSITEERPSVYISRAGHIVLGAIYSIMMFGYCALLIYNWTIRDETMIYTRDRTTEFPEMLFQVRAWCSNGPNCGTITLRVNYDGVPGCGHIAPMYDVVPNASAGTPTTWMVPLCFTNNPIYSCHVSEIIIPGVTVRFSKVNPGQSNYSVPQDPKLVAQGVVEVTDFTRPIPCLMRVVNLDSSQVKNLIVSQYVRKNYDEIENRTASPVGIQYDGKHPKWTATFILTLAEFTDTVTRSKTSALTFIGVLGSCAMAAWVVFVIMLCVIPFWPLLFPGPAQIVINQAADQAA